MLYIYMWGFVVNLLVESHMGLEILWVVASMCIVICIWMSLWLKFSEMFYYWNENCLVHEVNFLVL